MIAYFNGDFTPKESIRISPDDRGFLFADGVYEVVYSYAGKLFRGREHFLRMERSLRELKMAGPRCEDFMRISQRLITDNDLQGGNAKVYIQVSRGAAPRTHTFPDPAVEPSVYACASTVNVDESKWERGVAVILVPDNRWARCDIKSLALLPNVMAAQAAKERGVEEAIFVRDGAITEGSHTNFAAVFDGAFVTAPCSNYILGGITRAVVLECCGELGIPVREFPIQAGDLANAEEAMLTGTTAEVMPVVEIDGCTVGNGRPGPIAQKLRAAFRRATRG